MRQAPLPTTTQRLRTVVFWKCTRCHFHVSFGAPHLCPKDVACIACGAPSDAFVMHAEALDELEAECPSWRPVNADVRSYPVEAGTSMRRWPGYFLDERGYVVAGICSACWMRRSAVPPRDT